MMKTEYDIELLKLFETQVSLGDIKINENVSGIINEIEKHYPFRYSGIDWTMENYIFFMKIAEEQKEKREDIVNQFLKQIQESIPTILEEKVIVMGDYLTNLGFEMPCKLFLDFKQSFLDIPQDTYVWFPTLKKCINFTFEDELYFG